MKPKLFYKIIISAFMLSVFLAACSPAATQVLEEEVVVVSPGEKATGSDNESFILKEENASAGDAYIPEIGNRAYDVQQYHLAITLDPDTDWVEGTMEIDLISTQDSLQQISFDLVGLNVSEVLLDGTPVEQFSSSERKLFINFAEALDHGSAHTVSIQYNGKPVQEQSAYVPFIDYLGIQFREDMLYVVSEPDGARYWMPVNDHPRDKAGYLMEITVPHKYVAVSNGVLKESIDNGDTSTFVWDNGDTSTFVWENAEPLASALVTIAVGEYQLVSAESPNGIPLRSYVTQESAVEFADMQPVIGEMIDWMGEHFGDYPFAEFGYVEVSDIGASLETQSMVIMSESALFDEGVLCHEMSHMWFGDWVGLDSWSEIWRNEGFATYVSLLWEYRNNEAELDAAMQQVQTALTAEPNGFPLNNPPAGEMFGRDSYYKGALMVHDLRKTVGDEAFYSGLQNYFAQYGGGTASDAQFQAIMEESSGISLDAFFEEWFE